MHKLTKKVSVKRRIGNDARLMGMKQIGKMPNVARHVHNWYSKGCAHQVKHCPWSYFKGSRR